MSARRAAWETITHDKAPSYIHKLNAKCAPIITGDDSAVKEGKNRIKKPIDHKSPPYNVINNHTSLQTREIAVLCLS